MRLSQRPWSGKYQSITQYEKSTRKSKPTPKFSVPSVLLPPEAARSPTVHKIHILGEDERSKFIAHALSSVYDSVELLGLWRDPKTKFNNIQKKRLRDQRGLVIPEALTAKSNIVSLDDDSHIENLVVTGKGFQVEEALEAVKHRVDDKTTICLMNDGLGVLEDVRHKIFNDTNSQPTFLYGHMSHRLAFNRKFDSVKEITGGLVKLAMPTTTYGKYRQLQPHQSMTESKLHFVQSFKEAQDLRGVLTPIDEWLRFKLPSVIFDSVAEPVCVLFEMPYQGILQNPAAQRMMSQLLQEILNLVECLPEVEGSSVIRDYVRGVGPKRFLYNMLANKRHQQSELQWRVEAGLPTDINYLNGYFVRRAKKLGLDLRANIMMQEMVKARHSLAIEKRNSYISLEETSIPSELGFKYRTRPR